MMSQNDLEIRVSTDEDQKYLTQWLTDPEVLYWFPLDNSREIEDAVKIWVGFKDQQSALTLCLSKEPIGMAVVYLHRYKKLKHQSLFAIIMDKEHRGKGYGAHLLKEIITHAKEKFHLEILHLEVYEGNPAKKLYERLGFQEYGRQENFLKERNGIYRTKINMELVL